MHKRILTLAYLALLITMGAATLVEKHQGTAYVAEHIYGSWWFVGLWALMAVAGAGWLVVHRMRRASLLALHGALLLILAGALLTHLTAHRGTLHLRVGERATNYISTPGGEAIPLPYEIRLDSFATTYHTGTTSPLDYHSHLTVGRDGRHEHVEVSMNHIYSARGVRLYQSSFDDDGRGSTLAVNSDPWGIPVTYSGYGLLFVAFAWMLADPRGTFRRLLRHPQARRGITALWILVVSSTLSPLSAQHALPDSLAEKFGCLYVEYNGRICQVQTLAIDFTKKLCGKSHYGDYTAEQVLTGFIFYGDEWNREPLIRVKGTLREALSLPERASFDTFFSRERGYLLGPWIEEYMKGNTDKMHEEAMRYDDKLQLILQLRQGHLLKLFPFHSREGLHWHSPTETLPGDIEAERKQYISNIFSYLYKDALTGNHARMAETLDKMQLYQRTYGGHSVPTEAKTCAERLYNAVPFATILFMVNLLMVVVSLFARRLSGVVMALSWIALTTGIALRWVASGNVPIANGYETMLFTAWLIELATLATCRRFPITLTLGFLMSGFFLLVSHIGQMDPQITPLMPVLHSPLLSIHVSVIMMAYALLSMTFACSLAGLLWPRRSYYLHILSQLFLHPALAALAIGIFTGAVWANVSWGTYWSWDPKEVWALITLMVYAVAAHKESLPWLRKPRHYHAYMVAAFLTLLMTYFGVNYFLGGMHSYA